MPQKFALYALAELAVTPNAIPSATAVVATMMHADRNPRFMS
jgi:hypothetical protein